MPVIMSAMAERKGGLAASMAAAMDGLQLGLLVVQEAEIVLANEVVRQWLGDFEPPCGLAQALGKQRARQVLAWLGRGAEASLRLNCGRGKGRRTFELSGTAHRHRGRSAWLLLLRDITAVVQDEEELESRVLHMQRLGSIGRLSTTIAHEFGNFLQVLLGATTVARMEAGEAGVAAHLERIETVARRAAALCDTLRSFSRKAPRRLEPVRLQEVVLSMRDLERGFAEQGVALGFELDEQAGAVLGDPCQLQQALLNLLLNARDAMPDGGEVRVRLASAGDELELRVEDDGPGIPVELRERIFEPFFTTKGEHGSGMGLGVVAGIAEAHGGRIEVDSRLGEGTCFRLILPRSRAAARARPRPTPAARGHGRGGTKGAVNGA